LPSNSSAERQSGPPSADCHPGIGFREFVALLAALMAVNALSIDAMLPPRERELCETDVSSGM
jgi:MFS transporter, DHA1 family, multidrug resistance protein